MEVKIGIQSVPRELVVDTDATAAEIERDLTAALAATDGTSVFALATQKGGRVLIPADKIAFIEFSNDQARRVGFGNIVLRLAGCLATVLWRRGRRLVPWITIGQPECGHPS